MLCKFTIIAALALQLVYPINSLAASQARSNGPASAAAASKGLNLNLSSTAASVRASALGLVNNVSIIVGGVTRLITPSQLLTPAELVAAAQVASGGRQTLNIGAQGNALSGRIILSENLTEDLSSLVIPQGVKLFDNVANLPTLSLSGDLIDSGKLFLYSSSAQISQATIDADNIVVTSGGLLTSVLPSGQSMLHLNLNATGNITNAGTISSSGNLALIAGGSVINSLAASLGGPAPVLQAANNLNIYAGSGVVTNSGSMIAVAGNVNFDTQATNNLSINSEGGSVSALSGAIDVRSAALTNNVNLSIAGGNWSAEQINIWSGVGTVTADFGNVVGVVNTQAGQVHLLSDSNNLVLGNINVLGDPTYYNIGNIEITGNIVVGEDLAIVASGNITSTGSVSQITAQDGSGQGYNINIVAGANVSPVCGPCSSNAQSGSESTVAVTVNGASASGGNINFSASPNLLINSSSTAGNLNGGNITMAAYAAATGTGRILMPASSEISAGGAGSGANGNVTLIAGAPAAVGISVGQINNNTGLSGTGMVALSNAQPTTSNGQAVVFATNGSITSGNSFVAGTAASAQMTINGAITAGADLDLNTSYVTIGNSNLTSAGNLNITSNGSALTVNVLSSQLQTVGGGDINLTNNGTGEFVLNAAGSSISSSANINFVNNGYAMAIVNTSNSQSGAGSIVAAGALTITNAGDLDLTNIGSTTASTNGNLTINNAGGRIFIFNNSDSFGNSALFDVATTGNFNINNDGDIIVVGDGTLGTNDAAGKVNFSSTGGSLFVGQGAILVGGGVNVTLGNIDAAMIMYSDDGTLVNPNLVNPSVNPIIPAYDNQTGATIYFTGYSDWYYYSDSGLYIVAGSGTSDPAISSQGTLNVGDINSVGGTLSTFVLIRHDNSVYNVGGITAGGGNLFIADTNATGLTLSGTLDTTNGGSGGYVALYSPNLISAQAINSDQGIAFATQGNTGTTIATGDLAAGSNILIDSANVVFGNNTATTANGNIVLNGSGGLTLSTVAGTITASNGNFNFFNGGGALTIWSTSDIFNDTANISAGASLNVINSGGDINIVNWGGSLAAGAGNFNLVNNGTGSIYVLNDVDGGQNKGFIGVQTTGSVNISCDNDIYVDGEGLLGTNDAAGSLNLNGNTVVVAQGQILAAGGLNVSFAGNFLLYQTSGTTPALSILSGQSVSSLVDPDSYTVYYYGNQVQVLDGNGAIVLSTGSFSSASIAGGVLTVSGINGNMVISVRDDPAITSVGALTTNGYNLYLDSTATGGLNLSGNINTAQAGNGGSVLLYSNSAGNPNIDNITTSTATAGSSGGSVRVFAPSDLASITVGTIDTSSNAATGTGNNGGNVTIFAGSAINGGEVDTMSSGSGGNGNGGNLIAVAQTWYEDFNNINTYASGTSGNAGFVHLLNEFGAGVGNVTATANGATEGNGGAVTVVVSGGNSDIDIGNIDNEVFYNGNAGFNVDSLSGLTGTNLTATGNVYAGYIATDSGGVAINNGGSATGSGGNVNINAIYSVNVNGIDASAYANTGSNCNAGSITIYAGGNIVFGNNDYIVARGGYNFAQTGNGGGINISSTGGNIEANGSFVDTTCGANNGDAGFVHLNAAAGISGLGNVYTNYNGGSNGNSGAVTLITTGPGADIQVGAIYADTYNGGSAAGSVLDPVAGLTGVNIVATGSVNVTSIEENGANTGGTVTVSAIGSITLGTNSDYNGPYSITTYGYNGNSGDISLVSTGSTISVPSLVSSFAFATLSDAGNIYMSAPSSISTAAVVAVANWPSGSGNGGAVQFDFTGGGANTLQLGGLVAAEGGISFTSSGVLTIAGTEATPSNLLLMAGGDITFAGGPVTLAAQDAGGQGHDIYLIAGADLFYSAASNVTIYGVSNFGGSIDFSQVSNVTFNNASTCAGCSGGNIILAAYASLADSGHIILPAQTTINNAGNGGVAGSTTLIAGSQDSIAMQVGQMEGPGAAAVAGTLDFNGAQPTTTDGNAIVFDQNTGNITSDNDLQANAFQATEGEVLISGNVQSQANINFAAANVFVNQVSVVASGNITFSESAETPLVSLNVTLTGGRLSSSGGDISLDNESGGNTSLTNYAGMVSAANDISVTGTGSALSFTNYGTVKALSGTITINNQASSPGPGVSITNDNVGQIMAANGISITNSGGAMALYNTGSAIVADSGGIDIINSGGQLFIFNANDCSGDIGSINATAGNFSVSNDGDIIAVGNGVVGTSAAGGALNLTSTSGSIIFGQGHVDFGTGGVNLSYSATGNVLVYSNTNLLSPSVGGSPALSGSLTDSNGVTVYYYGKQNQVLNGDVIVLSTGSFASAGIVGGSLNVSGISGNTVIAVRNDASVTAIGAITTNGGNVYIEGTGSNGVTVNGAINTQGSGGNGYVVVNSSNGNTVLQSVVTSASSGSNVGGGSVALISAGGNLTVNGAINTFGDGVGNGGSIMITTLPGTGNVYLNGNINTTGGAGNTFGGGGVSITTCGSCNGGSITINTSASDTGSTFVDAGSISIAAGGGIAIGALTANGNSAFDGHYISLQAGGAVTIKGTINTIPFDDGDAGVVHITAASGITTDDIIATASGVDDGNTAAITLTTTGSNAAVSTGYLANYVSDNGDAGVIIDGASGTYGITISATGNVQTGGIQSSSANTGYNGSGGNVAVETGGLFSTTLSNGIDSSSYGTIGLDNNAGSVSIVAAGTITTGNVWTRGAFNGGNGAGGSITLESTGATVVCNSIDSTSYGSAGGKNNAGSITIAANNDLSLPSLRADGGNYDFYGGSGSGGNISITSTNGSVTLTGSIDASSNASLGWGNNSGSITIEAEGPSGDGYVTGNDLYAEGGFAGGGNGGNITVISDNGQVTLNLNDYADARGTVGFGGNVNVSGNTGVSVVSFDTNGGEVIVGGGNISLVSANGGVSVSQYLDSSAAGEGVLTSNGSAGTTTINASGDITFGVNSSSYTSIRANGGDASGNGADITITSANGSLIVIGSGFVDSSATECCYSITNSGNGGSITVNVAGSVGSTGNLFSYRSDGGWLSGNGGDISITAGGSVITDFIKASAPVNYGQAGSGNAGNITISAGGDVNTPYLGAVSYEITGNGGNISVTAGGQVTVGSIESTTNSNLAGNSGLSGTAGFVNIQAQTGISVTSFVSAWANPQGDGNDITLQTTSGAVAIGGSIGSYGAIAGNLIITTGICPTCTACTTCTITVSGYMNTSGSGFTAPSDSGFIHMQATNGITIGDAIYATSSGAGGDGGAITLMTTGAGGNISTAAISNYAWTNGNAGAVEDTVSGLTGINIVASGSVSTNFILASSCEEAHAGFGSGSNVNITANGTISLSGYIDAASAATTGSGNNAGSIILMAGGNINGTYLTAQSVAATTGNGGVISVTTTNGSITFSGPVDSNVVENGNGGNITFSATTGIATGDVLAYGGVAGGSGGTIILSTTAGQAEVGKVSSFSQFGVGSGDITISAPSGITATWVDASAGSAAANVSGNAGYITLTASSGAVTVSSYISAAAYVPATAGANFNGGNVQITAFGTITVGDPVLLGNGIGTEGVGTGHAGNVTITNNGTTGDLIIDSGASAGILASGGIGSGGGGTIMITVPGNIQVEQVASSAWGIAAGGPTSPLTGSGTGGNITMNAGGNISVSTSINSQGGKQGGNAGSVSLMAGGTITIGPLSASALNGAGNAGTVTLQGGGDVAVSGLLDANGGATSGNGGSVSLTSTAGNVAINGAVQAQASESGAGGNITLSAVAGSLAVNGANTEGVAIDSSGAGSAASDKAGSITIIYGLAAGTAFIIDPDNATIVNGVKGAIAAVSSAAGGGGTVSINNNLGDVNVTLNSTIDVLAGAGTQGSIDFNNPGTNVNVTGNSSGQLEGTVNAQGVEVTISLAKSATTLDVGTITASSLSATTGITLTVNTGASVINLASSSSVSANDGAVTITTPTLNNQGAITGTAEQVLITAATVNNTGSIDSTGTNGLVSISNDGSLTVDNNSTAVAGSISAGEIDLASINGAVSVTQGVISGNVYGSAASNFYVEATNTSIASNITAAGNSTATTGTITFKTDNGTVNLGPNAVFTAGLDLIIESSQAVTIDDTSASDPIALTAGRDVNISGAQAVSLEDTATWQGITITSGRDTIITSSASTLAIFNSSANELISISAGRNVQVSGNQAVSIGDTAAAQGVAIKADQNVSISSSASTVSVVDSGADQGIAVTAGVLGGVSNNPLSLNISDYTYSAFTTPGQITATASGGNLTIDGNVNMLSLGGDIGLTSSKNISIAATASGSLFAQGGNLWMVAANSLTIGNATTGETLNSVARYTNTGIRVLGDGWGVRNYQGGGLAIYAGVPASDFDTLLQALAVNRVPLGVNNVTVDTGVNVSGTQLILQTPTTPAGNLINYPYTGFLLTLADGSAKGPSYAISVTNSPIFNINGGVVDVDPVVDLGLVNVNNSSFNIIGPPLVPVAAPTAPAPVMPVTTTSVSTPIPTETTAVNPIILTTDQNNGALTGAAEETNINSVNAMASPIQLSDRQNSDAWVYVASSCQPFLYGYDDSILFGCGGTQFSPSMTRTLELKEGKMVAITGTKVLVVATPNGNVHVPAQSAAVIEETDSGVLRVSNLAGQDLGVAIKDKEQTTNLSAASGEEIIVADQSVKDEELIPVDGVQREPIGGKVAIASLSVQKERFNRQKFAEREPLLSCTEASKWWPIRTKLKKLKDDMGANTTISQAPGKPMSNSAARTKAYLDGPYYGAGSANVIRPVSYVRDGAELATVAFNICTLANSAATIKYARQTSFTVDQPGVISLAGGEMLIEAVEPTTIKADNCLVTIEPGTIAMVTAGKSLKVHDVWENNANSVKVSAGKKALPLSAGQELIVGESNYAVTSEVKRDPVARRRVKIFDLSDNKCASRSEVSIVSLMQNHMVLTELLHSGDAQDRTIAERLIKMAACLAQTTANHGPYSTTVGQ